MIEPLPGNRRGPAVTGIKARTIIEESGPATARAIEILSQRVLAGLGPDGAVSKNLKASTGIERLDGDTVTLGGVGATIETEDPSRWVSQASTTLAGAPTNPDGIAFMPDGKYLATITDGASTGTFTMFACTDYLYDGAAAIGAVAHANMDTPASRMQFSPCGRYCMVFGMAGDYLVLIDCLDPTLPVVASSLDLSANTPANMTGSAWSGKRGVFYFCDGTTDDIIYSIDVSRPKDIETHQVFQDTTNLNQPWCLVLSEQEDYLYVGMRGGVAVVNVKDQHELAWVETNAIPVSGDDVLGLDWQGNILAGFGDDASETESLVWNFEIISELDLTYKATASVSVGNSTTSWQDPVLNGGFLSFLVSTQSNPMYLVTFDVSSFSALTEVQALAISSGSVTSRVTHTPNHVAAVYTNLGGSAKTLSTWKCGRSSATSITASTQEEDRHSYRAAFFESLVGEGTEPYPCESRMMNQNLNAEFWHGKRPEDLTGKQFKSYNFSSRGVGAGTYFAAGYYEAPAAEAVLNQGALTQTLGSANVPYAAHVFFVAKDAGAVSGGTTGVATVTVTGTSITDEGVRDAGGSEVLVSDNTAASTDEYFETDLKWIGQVTLTIAQTGDRTNYDLSGNYGFAKYEDFGNVDFELTDLEAVGLAAANDASFNIELLLHDGTGWTYDNAAFVPGGTVVASMVGDHSTESDVDDTEHFAWKRVHLATEVEGTDLGGVVVRITTGANNTVQIMSIHLGAKAALL